MKHVHDFILSSGSSSDEANPSHPSQKIAQRSKSSKMAEVTEASDVTLRDIFMQLNRISGILTQVLEISGKIFKLQE